MLLAGYWQRSILRRYIPVSRWWIVTVSGGMALNHFVSDGFPDATDPLFALLATSFVVGVSQWLVLRRQLLSSGWWIPATVVGWSLGVFLGTSLLGQTDLLSEDWSPWLSFREHGLVAVVTALVYSIVTGVTMAWFLIRLQLGEASRVGGAHLDE